MRRWWNSQGVLLLISAMILVILFAAVVNSGWLADLRAYADSLGGGP